ncbi:MAG: hypothetical protein H7039_02620 [Bryobacteraceae bacterium]|nr:hypothetical protein [Bryobacteraceae bacterium]
MTTINAMFRAALIFVFLGTVLSAATIRLFLKDGTWHSVREYEKLADRVRYYSSERGEWEEIPLELVDLKKTETESSKREVERNEEAKLADAEEKAERAQQNEIAAIPYEAGVFQVQGEKAVTLKNAETKVVNDKRRSLLKAVSPLPIFTGKSTVEIDGLKASHVVPPGQPEFYVRMAGEIRFEMIRLTPAKNARVAQKWDTIPVSKELVETTDVVETFKQQLADGLYKVWPVKPLTAGEYGIGEWVEGKGNLQVWDFSVALKQREN